MKIKALTIIVAVTGTSCVMGPSMMSRPDGTVLMLSGVAIGGATAGRTRELIGPGGMVIREVVEYENYESSLTAVGRYKAGKELLEKVARMPVLNR